MGSNAMWRRGDRPGSSSSRACRRGLEHQPANDSDRRAEGEPERDLRPDEQGHDESESCSDPSTDTDAYPANAPIRL
jgi:hypothetical protein